MLKAAPAQAQALPGSGEATPDSIAERLGLPEGHSPRGALRRAAMVPGWGQYYNRQYWKMPFAVAGVAGAIFAVVYTWDRYLLYRNAWRYRRVNGQFLSEEQYGEQYGDDGPTYFDGQKYEQAYRDLLSRLGRSESQGLPGYIPDQRSQFRRYRDLSFLGIGLAHLLQIADAFVSAHLLGFEVAEDVSMQVQPQYPGEVTATLRLGL